MHFKNLIAIIQNIIQNIVKKQKYTNRAQILSNLWLVFVRNILKLQFSTHWFSSDILTSLVVWFLKTAMNQTGYVSKQVYWQKRQPTANSKRRVKLVQENKEILSSFKIKIATFEGQNTVI